MTTLKSEKGFVFIVNKERKDDDCVQSESLWVKAIEGGTNYVSDILSTNKNFLCKGPNDDEV